MDPINENSKQYLGKLTERAKQSKIYRDYQMTGLQIAAALQDLKHKALYIKLAKTRGAETLLRLAKSIAENPNVKNRGAYFMRVIANNANNNK
ncbi:MAG: hypothetical protein A3I24_03855 [Candidatus Harrisonbacteria bacterium RIFCSPLOWO2_02_FULL_41_13b]|uniref:Uncharacterized protein n=1 Tax=Candidatus Harrisonbacteria bacterium RIFCSPLOWO2_02_FULL_41_13b TaxID=1798409 RepID=A0A1G1ZSC9_9BACT|nr:MAG: hypothetical protein A3J53_01975 [Candidatus Harrisonbacteria bacterium RIFCSPHIGHO2_02_FULL_40_20]OGY66660.1 MAG: hypothetical protein A3I24_03855 [Candidatus Harrisonbacteria bacterium RIFCSPLOWO2_02_FULL_41_13b]